MTELILAFIWGVVVATCIFIFWPRPRRDHWCVTWQQTIRDHTATRIAPGVWECTHRCCGTTEVIEADSPTELVVKTLTHECEAT